LLQTLHKGFKRKEIPANLENHGSDKRIKKCVSLHFIEFLTKFNNMVE